MFGRRALILENFKGKVLKTTARLGRESGLAAPGVSVGLHRVM